MTIIEVGREQTEGISPRQRWSHYLVILYGVVMFIIGVNVRDSLLYATVPYEDTRVGVRAFYPQNWLLDTEGDTIFRVRDMTQAGFKTTLQVQIQPISAVSTARNLLDNLSLSRSQTLDGYRQFPRETVTLSGELPATAMEYTFIYSEPNPFLENIPTVVTGRDIIILQRGQAVIVSFQADADQYEQLYPIFETFLEDLDF